MISDRIGKFSGYVIVTFLIWLIQSYIAAAIHDKRQSHYPEDTTELLYMTCLPIIGYHYVRDEMYVYD